VRAVIAEDSVLLREGLSRLLSEAGIEVVGKAGDGDDLLRKARAHKPDVVITDIKMPPTQTDEGLRAARVIRGELPDTGVVLLSQYVEESYVMDLLGDRAEGVGYLLKDRVTDVERFLDAVARVAEGGSALDPEVVSHMLGRRRREDPLEELTAREREVLALMAEGYSNAAIASRLVVTERGVEKHVTNIFGKLGFGLEPDHHRRVLAVLTFLRSEPAR
jgi:DNA-binding NarL/FixJ family response regulator